ncbi:MAG: phage terminase large subunit family protein [Desulfobacterium sp.]|nr:phage terminase large subunit family protein [Desulfobacterium sp.]
MTIEVIKAAKKGVQSFRVQVPLLGAAWADNNFYLSPESSGTEGRWKSYPYQIGILNWMTSDDIEEVNFQKSRRVGYTKCLLAATASSIVQKNRNIAIWQPTDGDAKDFVTDEVDTMLRDVPLLGEKLKCPVGMKSKFSTLDKKVFHGAILDIKGGKSARNYRRMTKDTAIYDETDGFDRDIDNEGSCFELGDGRLDQAPFPKSIRGSTPKTKRASLIEAAVENSDMIFYRFVMCPHCRKLQRLEFSQLKWDEDRPETVRYLCRHNQCEIQYRDYPAMDVAGRWQTLDGYYYSDHDDRFYGPDDNLIDKPRRIGARIWAGYSYLRPWSYVVDKWISANRDAKTGNIIALKAVINTLLGETFEEQGETVNHTSLSQRGEVYLADGFVPNEVLVVTVGADVQGGVNSRIEMEFVGHGIEHETWSLGYVVIPGDAERPEVWDHADEELSRRFIREDGVSLGVSCAFIDSGYLAHEVYKFTGPRRRRNIFATKGVNTGTICNKGTWQGEKKRRAILHTVNVDVAKEIVFRRLQIEEPGPGFCHFPDHYTDRHYQQLTNEEKREKRKSGVLVGYEWIKKGPNEQLDCRGYALGAFVRLNPNMGKLKLRLERQAAGLSAQQDQKKKQTAIKSKWMGS